MESSNCTKCKKRTAVFGRKWCEICCAVARAQKLRRSYARMVLKHKTLVEPTDAIPGSFEKLEVLRLRATFCLELHVEGDRMCQYTSEGFAALNGLTNQGVWE